VYNGFCFTNGCARDKAHGVKGNWIISLWRTYFNYKGRTASLLKTTSRVRSMYCDHGHPEFLSHKILRHSAQRTFPEDSCIMIKQVEHIYSPQHLVYRILKSKQTTHSVFSLTASRSTGLAQSPSLLHSRIAHGSSTPLTFASSARSNAIDLCGGSDCTRRPMSS
jgi:hypothetical protein